MCEIAARLARLARFGGGARVATVVASACCAALCLRASPADAADSELGAAKPDLSPAKPEVSLARAYQGAAKADQSAIRLDAELRLRGAAGQDLSNVAPGYESRNLGWFQRSRLGAAFDRGNVAAYVQLQSSSALGTAGPGADPIALGLQQGWLRAQVPGLADSHLDAGRLALEFGAGRQIGRYDFDHIGHAFDGVLAHYGLLKKLEVDVFGAKLRRAAGQPDLERNLAGVYLAGQPSDAFRPELYVLYLADGSDTEKVRLLTLGTRLALAPAAWFSGDIEGAVQVGAVTQVTTHEPQDQFSWMAASELRVQAQLGTLMTFGVLGQMFSGDTDPQDKSRHGWRPLYPSRNQVVGVMQLFETTNLQQIGGVWRTESAWRGLQLRTELDVRLDRSAAEGQLPSFGGRQLQGQTGWQTIGTQADAAVRLVWRPGSELAAVASAFVPSPDLQPGRGIGRAKLAMLQWTASF